MKKFTKRIVTEPERSLPGWLFLLLGIIGGMLLAFIIVSLTTQAYAWQNEPEQRYCTPSVTPTPVEPTAGASATPTLILDVSTDIPSGASDGHSSSPDATVAHNLVCTVPLAAPILQGFVFHPDGIQTYSWWKSTTEGVEKQSVEYGYEIGNPLYGVDNLNPNQTSIDIAGLDRNRISWARVAAWKNGCVAYSNWFN